MPRPARWLAWDPRAAAPGLAIAVLALAVGVLSGVNPLIGIGAALGIALLALSFADLATGVSAFGFLVFLEVVPESGATYFYKVVGVILVLAWIARAAAGHEAGVAAPGWPLIALLLAFIAWALLSLSWAQSVSTGFANLARYGQNLLLFPIVWSAIRSRRHVTRLQVAIVSGATLAAVVAIASPGSGRAVGTVGDPNELAADLVVGLALAGTLMLAPGTRELPRAAAAAAAVLCLIGIFLSVSRGGLLALGCVAVASVVMSGRWRRPAGIAALLAVAVTVLYFGAFASPAARERVTTVQSGSDRTDLWTVGGRMVAAHPVEGVGVGNFELAAPHYVAQPGTLDPQKILTDPHVTHNTYLQIMAELGIVGLALFAAVVACSLACMLRAARAFAAAGLARMEVLSRGTFVALAGLLGADFFISQMYGKLLWLLLALGPALLAVARRSARERGGRGAAAAS